MPELPDPEKMPRAPEPLGTPKSLGGLADRAGVEIEEDQEVTEDVAEVDTMDSLRERAEEWTEDIEDRESVLAKEPEAEAELSEELQKEAES